MPSRRVLDAARTVRGLVRGPAGCLLLLLFLPVALIAFLLLLLFAPRRTVVVHGGGFGGSFGGGVRRDDADAGPGPQAFGTPPRALPAAEASLRAFVRGLALDAEFSREEALATPVQVTGPGSPGVADLLAEAQRRGWVEPVDAAGERLRVSDEGRTALGG